MQDQIQPQAGMAQVTQPAQDLPSAEPMMPQTQIPQQEEKKSRLPLILLIFFILLLIGGVAVGAYMITQKDKEAEPTATTTTLAETEETTTTTITDTEDPYEGWKKVELKDLGYSLMIPSDWDVASEETHGNVSNAVLKDSFGEIYALFSMCQLGDCSCEYTNEASTQTLFTITFLGEENTEILVSDCYDDMLTTVSGKKIWLEIDNPKGDNEGEQFGLGHETDSDLSLEELQTKYTDLKKILESVEQI